MAVIGNCPETATPGQAPPPQPGDVDEQHPPTALVGLTWGVLQGLFPARADSVWDDLAELDRIAS